MAGEQCKDSIDELVCQYITADKKFKTSTITKIKSKALIKSLLQFNRLAFKKGELH